MFYKYFFYIVLILAVIFTVGLCVSKPPMHTSLMVYNSDYDISETKEVATTKKTTNVTTQKFVPNSKTTQVAATKTVSTKQIQPQSVQIQKNIITSPKKVTVSSQNRSVSQSQPKKITVVSQPQKQQQIAAKQQLQVPQQVAKSNTAQKPQQQAATSKQEEIAWNIWRSNLQNKIMQDSKLPILPQGTVFKFSFDVDKYGKVSNVKTWSLTPAFNTYAIQYIAPVIKGYQGHSILDFPAGSNSVVTTVTGQWKISTSQKYSTSANFHDIETVKKEY